MVVRNRCRKERVTPLCLPNAVEGTVVPGDCSDSRDSGTWVRILAVWFAWRRCSIGPQSLCLCLSDAAVTVLMGHNWGPMTGPHLSYGPWAQDRTHFGGFKLFPICSEPAFSPLHLSDIPEWGPGPVWLQLAFGPFSSSQPAYVPSYLLSLRLQCANLDVESRPMPCACWVRTFMPRPNLAWGLAACLQGWQLSLVSSPRWPCLCLPLRHPQPLGGPGQVLSATPAGQVPPLFPSFLETLKRNVLIPQVKKIWDERKSTTSPLSKIKLLEEALYPRRNESEWKIQGEEDRERRKKTSKALITVQTIVINKDTEQCKC